MKNNLSRGQRVLLVCLLIFLLALGSVAALFWPVLATAASVRQLEEGLYAATYRGDYQLDAFLEQGGAESDMAVADYVIGTLTHGLIDLGLQGSAFGCSTLSVPGEGGAALFGRNFDWGFCDTMIVETRPKNGYASISTVNMDFLNIGLDALPEQAKMRLLAAAAPYAPMDGMNEMGLCVAVLMIDDRPAFSQDRGRPDLTTTTAVRVLLDQAADVEEAVALLEGYDLHASAGMMIHFALADRQGRSVVVEYIDNEMQVVESPIATNFYLTPGEKQGIGSQESHIRYEILDALLSQKSVFSMEDVRDALSGVSKKNFDSPFASTEWSTVYDQTTGEVRYYHRENYENSYVFRLEPGREGQS